MTAPAAGRRPRVLVPALVVSILAALLAAAPPNASASATAAVLATAQERQDDKLPPFAERINRAANVAISHIGDPYRYGAAGPHAFDCSGLTMWSYRQASMSLPRTSAAQYAAVRHIPKQNMIRGDLVFFHNAGRIYHVGIFLYWNADHRAVIVHAPSTGEKVHRSPVWTSSWYAGTRRP